MRFCKTIAIAAALLGLGIGSASAVEGSFAMNESDFIIRLQPVDVTYNEIYGIDEDRDGIVDDILLLEHSDTLA